MIITTRKHNAGTTSMQGLQMPEKENAARGDFEEEFEGWHEGLSAHENSDTEIFIRELKKKEMANPTRYITESEFPKKEGMIVVYKPYGSQGKGYYYVTGKNKWENVVITKDAKDKRKKLVSDMEGYAGDPDFETKKENSMQDTYRVGTHNRDDLIGRGKSSYGSKVDNSVCECPVCMGGKRFGMFACKNCKGEGMVKLNAKIECTDCEGTGDDPNFPGHACLGCKGTGKIEDTVNNSGKETIARWEAKSGKTWIELHKGDFQGKMSYDYTSSNGGGNLGWLNSDEEAINKMESSNIRYMKEDYPSTKRVK